MPIEERKCRRRSVTNRLFSLLCYFSIALLMSACGGSSSSSSSGQSQNRQIRTTAEQYVEQFYPLWFTYYQSQYATINKLVGPNRISPLYQIVVAINDDTLYASTFLDVSAQPVILTIPAAAVTYSILTLDPYGNIFDSGIPAQTPGVYGLTGPDYTGTLPDGITPITMPLNFTTLIFRADKYSSSGMDETSEAETFRESLLLQTLSDYLNDPAGGATLIVPEAITAVPFKTAADTLLTIDPIVFLQQLQAAVESSNTPPMTADQLAVSANFNRLFGDGTFNSQSSGKEAAFYAGAQAGYNAILNDYLSNTDAANWIHFTNIGQWGSNYLDRSAISEFIQFGNGPSTAAYYHTFKDGAGAALDGSVSSYVLTFPAGDIPQASRFWSVTAYTPQSIELIDNSADKYLVASYTPGLVTNSDGSISIYMSTDLPNGVSEANWLPVADGPFNIMLRVYGPEGSVANDTYVPPAIVTY
ncbi:MAG: DUF1214 domain-containing protein [Candidatus Binataceae bacterium]